MAYKPGFIFSILDRKSNAPTTRPQSPIYQMAEFTLETRNPAWTGFSSEMSFPS